MSKFQISSADNNLQRRIDNVFKDLNHTLASGEEESKPTIDMPIKHFLSNRSSDKDKWTEYDLRDVEDLDNEANKKAALDFLKTLAEDDNPNVIIGRKVPAKRLIASDECVEDETHNVVTLDHLKEDEKVDANVEFDIPTKRQRQYRK